MKKIFKGIEYLPVIFLVILCYKLLNNFQIVLDAYHFSVNIMVPFLWAFLFAYLLNPMVVWIEKKSKIKRFFAIVISYAIVFAIGTLMVKFAFPELGRSATDIIKNVPAYIEWTRMLLNEAALRYPEIFTNGNLVSSINSSIEGAATLGASMLSSVIMGAFSFANHLLKVAIGVIISIYFLLDKEKFIIGIKKILFGLLEEKSANHIVDFGTDVNFMFSRFIVGKTIDSLIIGVLAYFGMIFIHAPYPVLFAFIIGITNMIPFFGPFIGGVPVTLITLFFDPLGGLWCGLFILLLQQFDGYILGPKILGDSVGMSAFWIILSILVGGALFGVIGMLVAVPATAVLRNRAIKYLDKRLKDKGLALK